MFAATTERLGPGAARRGRAGGHLRGRRGRRHRLRLVRDERRADGGRQLARASARRRSGPGRSSSRCRWAPTAAPATPRRRAWTSTTIDAAALGREAAAKARATGSAQSIEPGDYPVVLEEYAVVDILDMLGYLGFSALAVQEERSFVEIGKRIGSPLVTIRDDGADPAGLPMAIDYEGVTKQRVPLVEAGVCAGLVYDSQTAARAGVHSTGHGLPAPNPYGPFPLNMVMDGGSASREELIGGLDRGLLVTRFHYTNPVHPKLGIVTGMTRDGTFLVEGGKIVGAGPEHALHPELSRGDRRGERRGSRARRRSRASSAAASSRRSASTPSRSRAPPSTDASKGTDG